jgi:hypothetical protein
MPLGEARDVIENIFLSLSAWQHQFNSKARWTKESRTTP